MVRMKLKILLFSWIIQVVAMTDSEAVRQARLDQNYLLAAGDIERASAFWTEDVTVRRGFGASLVGKDTYREMFRASNKIIFVREPDIIEVSTDWPLAFESGTWSGRRESNGPAAVSGRYSAQWVKRDGYWLIRSEVFVALSCHEDPADWPISP
jgi:ketosteroid isomerase-like protein